jgi:hypothetical protein
MPYKKGEIPKGAIPFVSGDPRINRNGRPKKPPELNEILADILNEERDGISAVTAIFAALREKAVKGDVQAIKELLDRAYGKPKQSVDVTSDGEAIHTPQIITTLSPSELSEYLKK